MCGRLAPWLAIVEQNAPTPGDEFIERAQRQAIGIDEHAALAGEHLVAPGG
jgi:hypothetical protein